MLESIMDMLLDGIYVEIGETGSMVKDPQMVKLTAG
ncbi:YjzC family protein, partial [Bacillus sp. D-CC]